LGALSGQTNQGFQDGFVVQYSPAGEQVWTHQFGSSNLDDPFGISVGASGVYVAGLTGGEFRGQKYAGNADAFVAKLAPSTGSAADDE
jgi:outer membrane protein assembly factor BamB